MYIFLINNTLDTTLVTPASTVSTSITGTTPVTGATSSQSTTGAATYTSPVSTVSGQTTTPSATLSSTIHGSTTEISAVTGATTKRCVEMQAVDEAVSKNIVVRPVDVPKDEKTHFQPTSKQGVSFPNDEKTPKHHCFIW